MKRLINWKKGFAFTLILAMAAVGLGWQAVSAFASSETAASSVALSGVTLQANSSYVTAAYAGVQHLSVADSSVACASEDSLGRVVVTGIASGSTTASFWYRTSLSSNWVSAALPVTVSGVAETSASVDFSSAGIVLAEETATVTVGASYTPTGIRVNGVPENAGSLLWVSGSDGVISVDKKTGKITALAAGTATVYVVDPSTKACATLTVTVPKV